MLSLFCYIMLFCIYYDFFIQFNTPTLLNSNKDCWDIYFTLIVYEEGF